jgi:hypothetical protein
VIFKTDEDVINLLKENQQVTPEIKKARLYTTELLALVDGEGFINTIKKIENIESERLYKPRKLFSRDVQHLVSRIINPTYNVFSARGGSKSYNKDDKRKPELISKIQNIISGNKEGKSLEVYLEEKWVGYYHYDPAGVMWLRYYTGENMTAYPTYHEIFSIRNYKAKGQLVEWIIFEPEKINKSGKQIEKWIVVDDLKQYTIYKDGDVYSISTDALETFEHPFGQCPIIINSNLTDRLGNRISPLHKIIPVINEYAADQSVKTIYKRRSGFPKGFQAKPLCVTCKGHKYSDDKTLCATCDGSGFMIHKDVEEVFTIPIKEDGTMSIKGSDVMGHSSPDINYLTWASEEAERLENDCYYSVWGIISTAKLNNQAKTATEIMLDKQPQINQLNKISNVAEFIEWKFSEWIINLVDPLKEKNTQAALVVYPRRYILDGVDSMQARYEKAKENGDNAVILDDLFMDLISVKYKNDISYLYQALKKAKIEPHIHDSVERVLAIFGKKEAAKKMYFSKWWSGISEFDIKDKEEKLISKFESDFEKYYSKIEIENESGVSENPIENQLGKIPLALQQLKNARDGAIGSGDNQLANAIGNKSKELLKSI